MSAVAKYIKGLLEQGQHHFTTEDAVQALGGDRKPIARALKRLISKGELASPQRSFYVVVPPEYKVLGCLPAEQFIPHLMENVGESYHVGLLSAAQLHGAAHHRPQRFQVMVGKPKPKNLSQVGIRQAQPSPGVSSHNEPSIARMPCAPSINARHTHTPGRDSDAADAGVAYRSEMMSSKVWHGGCC